MSFQAYLDNIRAKTGKTPDDFRKIAEKKGLLKPDVKAGAIVAWLKKDFDLGHGHAMAIYTVFKGLKEENQDSNVMLQRHFGGAKQSWRDVYDKIIKAVNGFGKDAGVEFASSYISLTRSGKKFALIQVKPGWLDIGIKLKGTAATERFRESGNWNIMVTHRVRVQDPKEVDRELLNWLKTAYVNCK